MTLQHEAVHTALPEICDQINEAIELIQSNWQTDHLRHAIAELEFAVAAIDRADDRISMHNHAVDRQDSGNWDGACWRDAQDGDQIRLRDPQARDNGGPVYVIDGVPFFRPDGTMSVRAFLLPAPTQSWNWPEGNCQLEFAYDCWQVWRDFA